MCRLPLFEMDVERLHPKLGDSHALIDRLRRWKTTSTSHSLCQWIFSLCAPDLFYVNLLLAFVVTSGDFMSLLHIPLHQIDEARLQALIVAGAAENRTIDYKRTIYG